MPLYFSRLARFSSGIAHAAKSIHQPLASLEIQPVSLDPWNLPQYALLTTLRMFAALGFSLLFTFLVAPLAAKSKKAERVIIPALDILQSVPVLGFLTFTVVFFMSLFPGSQFGAELAAIFAIFTSQAWNMTFSFYQSLTTVPGDLEEAARHFRLSPWMRFWKLDVPFAMPGLVWNMMMSMSGGWFFVVASEAISVGDTKIMLPGIGSYISLAIEQQNIGAVAWAVGAMAVVIVLYDQLVFRPVVAWSDKFRVELVAAQAQPESWVLDLIKRARFLSVIGHFPAALHAILQRQRQPPVEADPGSAQGRQDHEQAGRLGLERGAPGSRGLGRLAGLVLCARDARLARP